MPAEPARRITRLSPEQRRAQLVAIGVELLADRSLDELSTDEVARRAGISRGLLFHYFDSKRDFHRAVVQAECDRFTAATDPGPDLGPVAALRAVTAGFVDHVVAHRRTYLALVRGSAGSHPAVADIVDRTREALTGRIVELHRRAGLPDSPRLPLAVRSWMAFAEEAAVLWPVGEPGARDDLLAFLESGFVALSGALQRPGVLDGGTPQALRNR
jgi:AcrR family transcriptional regulator